MAKKAIIVITLVDESGERSNEELEREIFSWLDEGLATIPWMKRVVKVEVVDNWKPHR